MRLKIIAFLILFLIGGGLFFYQHRDKGGPAPTITTSEPTNFNEVGVLHFPAPESGQAAGTFEYHDGSATTTLKIAMDELSYCAVPNGAILCMAMSITFDKPFGGKAALMEGTRDGDTILVRKMQIAADGEELRSFDPGNVFIPWPQAIELFKACEVSMATQTHALDVYLDLKDGRKVRAVEPTIDEMFTVIQETQDTCGSFPVATE